MVHHRKLSFPSLLLVHEEPLSTDECLYPLFQEYAIFSANDFLEYTPNTCEVSLVILYEIPRDVIRMYPEEFKQVPDEVYEMGISLNFTTYANKVRLNVISRNPDEKTLGQKIYPFEKLTNSFEAQNLIMEDVCKILYKNFSNYEFIF